MSNGNMNLSRNTISQDMAKRGMRPAYELAADKPCGTRIRYYAGCRCTACRAANTAYEKQRAAARARGESNHLVSATPAREHLQALSRAGVGYKTAADAAKVASSVVSRILSGEKTKIRAQTERRILAVTGATAADGALIDAAPTWRLLDELIACGYPRAHLASELLGTQARALQLSRHAVTVRNAARVRQLYERLHYTTATAQRRAAALLKELREEGFSRQRVLAAMAQEADRRGWPAPTLAEATKGTRIGHLRAQEAQLLAHAHRQLMGLDLEEGPAE